MAEGKEFGGQDAEFRRLVALIVAGEYGPAKALLNAGVEALGHRRTISDILEPALDEIGRRWDREQISLAAGYLAGKVAEDLFLHAAQHQQSLPLDKGPVIIGNTEDDYHALGRKMVGIFLQTAGWRVIDLGNDVPANQFVDAALEHGARIIGVSAMMFTTARNIAAVRREIDRRIPDGSVRLAVGGAVFKIRPELVGELGGDGTAANAIDVPALFDRLCRGSG
jgi:methanogenic corrinoid protein MtbC1